MRVIHVIFAMLFFAFPILPTFAAEPECEYEPTKPGGVFIEATKREFPALNEEETTAIARIFELAYQQGEIVDNNSVSKEEREFATRMKDIALTTAADQIFAFRSSNEMEKVIEAMRLEEASGLKEVSDALKPTVRAAAGKMILSGVSASEISRQLIEFNNDRAIHLLEGGGIPSDIIEGVQRAMCTLHYVVEAMAAVSEFLPTAMMLAHAEHIYYQE